MRGERPKGKTGRYEMLREVLAGRIDVGRISGPHGQKVADADRVMRRLTLARTNRTRIA